MEVQSRMPSEIAAMQNVAYLEAGRCVREPRPHERNAQRSAALGAPRVREHLVELLGRLRLAQSAAATCMAALRQQNCELDEDVARLLQRCVAEPLGEQIEQTEEILGALADPGG